MSEGAGPATHTGIFYQNTVAAQYLADLLRLERAPQNERVVEVRVEAPAHVDDVVVRYADGHSEWIQAKSNLRASGKAWIGLWADMGNQFKAPGFRNGDRLVLSFDKRNELAEQIQALAERAATSLDKDEWLIRLGKKGQKTLGAISKLIPEGVSAFDLFRKMDVRVTAVADIERDFQRLDLRTASAVPTQLLSNLRDIVGGESRVRGVFRAAPLRKRLAKDFGADLFEPREWGLPAYRDVVRGVTRIEIPGRGTSVPVEEIIVWPRVRRLGDRPNLDFEDELPRWDPIETDGAIDLSQFPDGDFRKCVLVAGPGFGKSTIISAVAARSLGTPIVPVELSLGDLASSDVGIVEYMEGRVNRDFAVRVDWRQLADQGLLCVLFDGLDEVPTNERVEIIKRIGLFSSRFPLVSWILTVRDPGALNAPLDADLLELQPFDNQEISELVGKFKRWSPDLDEWDFTNGLQAYPDIAKLARIPLFLSIMLAGWNPKSPLPRKRSDLIEQHLKTLFDPNKRKSNSGSSLSLSALRKIAQAIAFECLEREQIGLSERHAIKLISAHTEEIDETRARLVELGILRRTVEGRLQFPYPIIQEYLAAVHLIETAPAQVAARISDIIKRPWAQVIQFALELLPDASAHIRTMLNATDDAFSTTLRLVGRCVANGASIDAALHSEIGERLAKLWGETNYRTREKVGRVIVDEFSNPLHPEVQRRLGWRWLIGAGADEIISNANNPALTRVAISQLLEGRLDSILGLRRMRACLQAIAPEVVEKVTERATRQGADEEDLDGITDFIDEIRLSPDDSYLAKRLAEDGAQPLNRRCSAYATMAGEPSEEALNVAHLALFDDQWRSRSAAMHLFSRATNAREIVGRLLTDAAVTHEIKEYVVKNLDDVCDDHKAIRREVSAYLMTLDGIDPRHRDILRIYRARGGDREIFIALLDDLDRLSSDLAQATLAGFNAYRELELGERAIRKLQSRTIAPDEVPSFINSVICGLTYELSHDGLDSYGMDDAPKHPSYELWQPLIDKWLATEGFTSLDKLDALSSALRIRPDLSEEITSIVLAIETCDSPEWEGDSWGHVLRRAMDDVRKHGVQIPFDLAETFALSSTPNLPYAGIAAIAAHATPEALDRLFDLYHRIDQDHRSDVLDAIELVSSRLNIRIPPERIRLKNKRGGRR